MIGYLPRITPPPNADGQMFVSHPFYFCLKLHRKTFRIRVLRSETLGFLAVIAETLSRSDQSEQDHRSTFFKALTVSDHNGWR